MATRSRICLQVKKEDLHKTIIPDDDMLFGKIDKDGHSENQAVSLDNDFVSIYHHWDSMPGSLGRCLMEHYDDYGKAMSLILHGDASNVVAESEDDVLEFYYYSFSEAWEWNIPKLDDTIEDVVDMALSSVSYLYAYIQDGEGYRWMVARMKDGMSAEDVEFKPLEDVLSEEGGEE